MGSAERLACPGRRREGSVGTYVVPAYRSPFGSTASLMRHRVAQVRSAGTGVGDAVKHHGCAAATRRRRTGLPRRTEVFRMAFCHETYPPFEVTVQRDDAVATVVATGELDLATVPRLSATITEHSDASLLVLGQVLDLCELDGRLAG